MTAICSCWKRRCSACATRSKPFIATARPSATPPWPGLGKNCEITRFKGLGEISPSEFKQFIGHEMRLSQVEYAPKPDAAGHPGILHGQKHPRAQGLHHGKPGRAGGGLIGKMRNVPCANAAP